MTKINCYTDTVVLCTYNVWYVFLACMNSCLSVHPWIHVVAFDEYSMECYGYINGMLLQQQKQQQ